MALFAPLFFPKTADGKRGFVLAMAVGLLLGFTALGTVWLGGLPISGCMAGLAVILAVIGSASGRLVLTRELLRDLMPFGVLIVCLFCVNIIEPLRTMVFDRLSFRIHLIPVHAITFRPFFSAYLYIFLSFLVAARLQKVSGDKLKQVVRISFQKGWRAFAAMSLFGAMGQVISFTGYASGFASLDQSHNMPWIISQGLVQFTGSCYPIFVPLLGWVGTFLTGYGVASLMLFGQLQVKASTLLGISGVWLSAALAVGSSIGSISSPFKISLATAMVGAVGREGSILRLTIPLGAGASLLVGVFVWLFT